MTQVVYMVMRQESHIDSETDTPIAAGYDPIAMADIAKAKNDEAACLNLAMAEIRESFEKYRIRVPRPNPPTYQPIPTFNKQDRINLGQKAIAAAKEPVIAANSAITAKWNDDLSQWFMGHYPDYERIMRKHGVTVIVPGNKTTDMWIAVQGMTFGEISYCVIELTEFQFVG
jgi:hypothetical protein